LALINFNAVPQALFAQRKFRFGGANKVDGLVKFIVQQSKKGHFGGIALQYIHHRQLCSGGIPGGGGGGGGGGGPWPQQRVCLCRYTPRWMTRGCGTGKSCAILP
jgi:hypothetical protein